MGGAPFGPQKWVGNQKSTPGPKYVSPLFFILNSFSSTKIKQTLISFMLNFHFWIFLEKFPLPKGQTQSIFKITPLLSILAVIANSECVHIVHYGHILVQPAQKQGWPSNNLDLKIQNDAIFEIFMILKIQWLFNELEVKKKILYYIFDKKLTTFAK